MPKIDTQKLLNIRNARGAHQIDLAKAAGISRTYLSEIETGKKTPSKPVIAALATALSTPSDPILPSDLGVDIPFRGGVWKA